MESFATDLIADISSSTTSFITAFVSDVWPIVLSVMAVVVVIGVFWGLIRSFSKRKG